MARQSSKIMSIADKKSAVAGLKTAIKQHNEATKKLGDDAKHAASVFIAAEKACAAAVKTAEAALTAAMKVRDVAVKAANKDLAEAKKVYDTAVAKGEKAKVAAAKGSEKLTTQLTALEATPTAEAPKAGKLKAKAEAPATV